MNLRGKIINWMLRNKRINSHISFRFPFWGNRVTVYGANAMWFSVNVHTMRWGYICFRPPTGIHPFFGWKFYISPNGTPWACTFAVGNVDPADKKRATLRRDLFGHNFSVDENYQELLSVNGKSSDLPMPRLP